MSVHILLFQYFYFNMSLSIHVFAGFLFIGDGTWPFINLISSIFNSSILSSCNLALEKRYPCNREVFGREGVLAPSVRATTSGTNSGLSIY